MSWCFKLSTSRYRTLSEINRFVKISNVCSASSIHIDPVSRSSRSVHSNNTYQNEAYSCVLYKLPYIRIAGLINRMKLYQTVAAGSTAIMSVALNQMSVLPISTVYAVAYLGLAACLPFYTIGILCTNLVGSIYLSHNGTKIKISHINFWGRRMDTDIEVEDILPFSEISANPSDIYFKLERYSSSSRYKISLKYGKIENKELFIKTFGDIQTNK